MPVWFSIFHSVWIVLGLPFNSLEPTNPSLQFNFALFSLIYEDLIRVSDQQSFLLCTAFLLTLFSYSWSFLHLQRVYSSFLIGLFLLLQAWIQSILLTWLGKHVNKIWFDFYQTLKPILICFSLSYFYNFACCSHVSWC